MPHAKLLCATILLALIEAPAAMAANEAPKAAAAQPECYGRFGIRGHANRTYAMARLSAMRDWTRMAMKYGEAYSMWHNARTANVRCQTIPESTYFICFASGKPCRATTTGRTASRKTE